MVLPTSQLGSSVIVFFFVDFFPTFAAVPKLGEGEEFDDSPAPCPDGYEQFCEHGQCEMRHNLPTCRSVRHTALSAATWWTETLTHNLGRGRGGTKIVKLCRFGINIVVHFFILDTFIETNLIKIRLIFFSVYWIQIFQKIKANKKCVSSLSCNLAFPEASC